MAPSAVDVSAVGHGRARLVARGRPAKSIACEVSALTRRPFACSPEGGRRDQVNHARVLSYGGCGVGWGDRRVGAHQDDVAGAVAEDVAAAGDRETEPGPLVA